MSQTIEEHRDSFWQGWNAALDRVQKEMQPFAEDSISQRLFFQAISNMRPHSFSDAAAVPWASGRPYENKASSDAALTQGMAEVLNNMPEEQAIRYRSGEWDKRIEENRKLGWINGGDYVPLPNEKPDEGKTSQETDTEG